MGLIKKWNEIVAWQKANTEDQLGDLAEPIAEEQLAAIENLLGEPLPVDFKTLYRLSNGQLDNGSGLFFGEGFLGSAEIIAHLELHIGLVNHQNKPEKRIIENPDKSQELIKKIVDFYLGHAPKNKFFGLKKTWHKIEFSCTVGTYEGPYLYKSESTDSHEREPFHIDDYSSINAIIEEIYELERMSYRWDFLHFEVFSNGTFKVDRKDDEELEYLRTSTPDNCIKKLPFHSKWVPVFTDYGGNYIGIDLDPAILGVKGQIINFGRDEENMYVYANNLEGFFDLILNEITANKGEAFNNRLHLHEIIKRLVK